MSAFAQWILEELNFFSLKFIQQIFIADDFGIIAQCINIVEEHCRKLEDFGISVSFHLMQLLSKDITNSIQDFHEDIEIKIAKYESNLV
jgi:hypothetical protein